MTLDCDIAIVGGGAAGLAAACAAARGGRVTLLERGDRVGRKLLVTGNGKCNLTNTHAAQDAHAYYGAPPAQIAHVLRRCPPEAVLRFFRSIGLLTRTDAEGRVYPYSEQAAAVLDVLRAAAAEHGVQARCGFDAAAIEPHGAHGFAVRSRSGETVTARAVIAACGGPAAPANGGTDAGLALLRSLGHTGTPFRPALVPLRTDALRTRPLKGVRVKCAVALQSGGQTLRRELGELQFGDGLLSGICVFQLSRLAGDAVSHGRSPELVLDLLPELTARESDSLLHGRVRALRDRPAEAFFTGVLPKKIGGELLRAAVPDWPNRVVGSFTDAEVAALARLCRDWRFPVHGTGAFAAAQVSAGGLRLSEFAPDTMMSRKVPGLFAVGELLNVDGICGGYNLQWAWCTGLLAGRAAAAYCRIH